MRQIFSLREILVKKTNKPRTFPWVLQSKFEANRSMGSWVMIRHTNKQTNRDYNFVYLLNQPGEERGERPDFLIDGSQTLLENSSAWDIRWEGISWDILLELISWDILLELISWDILLELISWEKRPSWGSTPLLRN